MIASNTNDLSNKFALDTNSLSALKKDAKAGTPAALKETATQFEAMFINMMMKSMRDATPQDEDGFGNSQQTKTFTTMLDQQTSQNLAKRGMGLADVLVRQLSSQQMGQQALAIGAEGNGAPGGAAAAANPFGNAAAMLKSAAAAAGTQAPAAASDDIAKLPATTESGRIQAPHVRAFQEKLHNHALEAEKTTGVPAKFMLGQAALETGWGKRMIKNADGSNSHNLFGIKAGPGWKGKVAESVTTEYVNGRPQTRVEKFRAYDSPADSFKDYANMLANNPRYEKVINSGGDAAAFARGLQRAGYATDPHYATKLTRVIRNSLA